MRGESGGRDKTCQRLYGEKSALRCADGVAGTQPGPRLLLTAMVADVESNGTKKAKDKAPSMEPDAVAIDLAGENPEKQCLTPCGSKLCVAKAESWPFGGVTRQGSSCSNRKASQSHLLTCWHKS